METPNEADNRMVIEVPSYQEQKNLHQVQKTASKVDIGDGERAKKETQVKKNIRLIFFLNQMIDYILLLVFLTKKKERLSRLKAFLQRGAIYVMQKGYEYPPQTNG